MKKSFGITKEHRDNLIEAHKEIIEIYDKGLSSICPLCLLSDGTDCYHCTYQLAFSCGCYTMGRKLNLLKTTTDGIGATREERDLKIVFHKKCIRALQMNNKSILTKYYHDRLKVVNTASV